MKEICWRKGNRRGLYSPAPLINSWCFATSRSWNDSFAQRQTCIPFHKTICAVSHEGQWRSNNTSLCRAAIKHSMVLKDIQALLYLHAHTYLLQAQCNMLFKLGYEIQIWKKTHIFQIAYYLNKTALEICIISSIVDQLLSLLL